MGNQGFVELMRSPVGIGSVIAGLVLIFVFIIAGGQVAKALGREERNRREELRKMLASGEEMPDREY